ncbi:MAG: thiamine phosphate synthase [Phycisphaerales bacterium]|nr:thiamine phosphate synthase [Phycisphaerales bacterium]
MNPLHRLIDANANRASEALRLLEDLARFVADDLALSAAFKASRHDLASAMAALPASRAELLASRDTPGDVGTTLTASDESGRAGARALAGAAAGRAGEALRTLEEATKAVAPGGLAPGLLKALRYRVYDLEKRLVPLLRVRGCPQWRVCVLVTEALMLGRPWHDVVGSALDAGAEAVQLREKEMPDRELFRRGEALARAAHARGAQCIINDRLDIALACGADGVHLGQGDLPVQAGRALAGDRLWIGCSASTVAMAVEAVRAGADVLGLGPMYPSTTKPKGFVAGVGLMRDALAEPVLAPVPHLAISGIDAARARELAGLGCRGVAVSAAVCSAPDPGGAVRAILGAWSASARAP